MKNLLDVTEIKETDLVTEKTVEMLVELGKIDIDDIEGNLDQMIKDLEMNGYLTEIEDGYLTLIGYKIVAEDIAENIVEIATGNEGKIDLVAEINEINGNYIWTTNIDNDVYEKVEDDEKEILNLIKEEIENKTLSNRNGIEYEGKYVLMYL